VTLRYVLETAWLDLRSSHMTNMGDENYIEDETFEWLVVAIQI
jgi:hypothetical protein